ncbi:MAG TPA: Fic family protein [Bacteroidia bacterium]|nr:Fic family protein [Bacteroidia bacterium]
MWSEIEKYTEEFYKTGLDKVLDFEKFNRIAIVHHSSAIEGSTLTLEETALLISEGITAKGKSMNEHEMVNDHYKALLFCIEEAAKKAPVTVGLLKQINSLVNKNTGQVRNTPLGICEDTKGNFRLGNVTAGTTYFVNYDKVPAMVKELCEKLQSQIVKSGSNEEIYRLSFDAHYYLVTIHPWFDGNGRTSRLLMNYIQAYHSKPLSLVFIEDKPAYITALNETREKNDLEVFRNFMCSELIKYFTGELEKYRQSKKGFPFMF